ncbi:pyridoxamine 5'-phosphate oxidase family protein [Streptomyces calidiresistens]|uniref:Pyridoxamine 5-phosphate oxidase n=1 Tax=Streptomyces calidiresistens TaxID=1485586 RepID=A0A7W3T6X1_9ACTN|nr:pyridoxamine 5'-phosphate oxidase family protein [Streptomyces calidiresistens]MBB0232067.1 pyridoxamine 5-phosphate oxidase [Streptomyces calidiresistens]
MTSRYARLLFTPAVQRHQERNGSRRAYARMEAGGGDTDRLGPAEAAFVASRTSFYLASVGSTGWPYVQHRGGPPGFLRVVDDRTLAFAEYRGNRQYITTGNLDGDDRVSLLLMDYPNAARLKILGRARTVPLGDRGTDAGPTVPDGYRAVVERTMVIDVEAYDWNCPQHIEARYTLAELEEVLEPIRDRMARLEAENAALRKAVPEGAVPGGPGGEG